MISTLEEMRLAFERSGNPFWVWFVLNHYVETNEPLPAWVSTYLTQCAGRMLSEKARRSSDLRKVLPWVFGFPKQSGRGNLLNPVNSRERLIFGIKFGLLVLGGEDPVTARRNACNFAFDGKEAEVDDKTLQSWIREDFNLEKAPKSAEQWKEAIVKELLPLYERIKHATDDTALRALLFGPTKSREFPP
jgi:hypothetical protein